LPRCDERLPDEDAGALRLPPECDRDGALGLAAGALRRTVGAGAALGRADDLEDERDEKLGPVERVVGALWRIVGAEERVVGVPRRTEVSDDRPVVTVGRVDGAVKPRRSPVLAALLPRLG